MKKLNWGHYILITFILFVMLIFYMVFRSYQHNNDLVAENYYEKEIGFQDVIDKKENARKLDQDIHWKSENSGILLTYPNLGSQIKGKIVLFRPSDKNLDLEFEIAVDEKNQQKLQHSSLVQGKYILQIDWSSGGEKYYTEGSAYVFK